MVHSLAHGPHRHHIRISDEADHEHDRPGRTSAIDKHTTRHVGYRISQSCRAMVECLFGWGKQHGTMRKTKHRNIAAVGGDFLLNLIACNLVRIPKLIAP